MGHWDAVLAELIEERKKLDALIEMASERAGKGGSLDGNQAEIRKDTFFGMKAPEAIKKFLSLARGPKSPNDIAEALQAGGYQSTSKDLPNTLRTALRRMADDDEVVSVGGDWGLADWYPGRTRKKKENGEETTASSTEPEPPA